MRVSIAFVQAIAPLRDLEVTRPRRAQPRSRNYPTRTKLALLCQPAGCTKPKRIDRLRSGYCLVDRAMISTGHADTPRPERASAVGGVLRPNRRDPRA